MKKSKKIFLEVPFNNDITNTMVVQYKFTMIENEPQLTLTYQEYELLQKLHIKGFPSNFTSQNTGISYELFDVVDVDNNLVAFYVKI